MKRRVATIVLCCLLFVPHLLAEELSSIVPDDSKLEALWEEGGFTEGVAAGPDGLMYFSDFAQPFDSRPARIMKFDPRTSETKIHSADSKMANGLMFDRKGRLLACCASPLGGRRAVVEVLPDGSLKTIVDRFKGQRFNSPNDIVIDHRGRVYFSDPKYVGPEKMELPSMDVYRLDPDGSLHRATTDITKPNGVMLSPDGKTFYVAETDNGTAQAETDENPKAGRMTLNAFPVKPDGSLGKKRVLVNFGKQTGIDGMTVDQRGHIYAAVRSADRFGIVAFDPSGEEQAYIKTPSLPTNCCFGIGEEAKTLYITAGGGFYRIRLNAVGHHPARAEVARAESRSWLFVSLLREKKIVTFERDPQSGELSRRGETACPAEPAFLSTSPDRRTLLASFRSTGQLASFRIEPDGSLKPVSVVDGGEDPAYLLADHTGRFLLSAYYAADKVTVHTLSPDGTIGKTALQTILTADKAHGFAVDSENRFAFVPHTGANRIYQFYFNERTGRLTASHTPSVTTPDEDHPRHIALHPSDRWAYVSNEAGDSIGVFEVDQATGMLQRIQTLSTLPDDFDGSLNATARCEITPYGRFVYVANRGHDSIACFAIDQETGRVTSLGQELTEQTPRSFTIDPTGRYLYAAGQSSGKVAAYSIRDDGTLDRFATYESGPVSWWALAVDTPTEQE
jgi:6-phosphogluconolactonase (cycloisomerase 2 family)/sugar lactone lactonase YvrE